MLRQKLTKAQEQCLRDQAITNDQPGPVLRDFQVLLDFLGHEGVEASGKSNLLPMKFIEELDGRLSRPLHLDLKRPQLKSHPYLHGLNLLLRASGLSRVEGTGAKTSLVIDPEMRAQWDRLNPTEQYFNLLEAWLRFGRAEMVGERDKLWEDLLQTCLQAWRSIPEDGCRFDLARPQHIYIPGLYRDLYMLALMDLFGLMRVEIPRRPISPWCPAGIDHVPFGDALLTLLGLQHFRSPGIDLSRKEDEDQEGGMLEVPRFGAWQPLFQPCFPNWRENLELPQGEPREGTFVFRVSLVKMWRMIAMPADDTLDSLVHWILHSVDFDSDHLYEFTYRDRLGATVRIRHPIMDEGPWADQVLIGALPMEPGQTMELTYDFGDDWRFTIKLERIEPPNVKIKAPRILEKHGKAPEQYSSWDE
jgi:Plasmid pRiA4b ORF-3-like protein